MAGCREPVGPKVLQHRDTLKKEQGKKKKRYRVKKSLPRLWSCRPPSALPKEKYHQLQA